MLNLNNIGMIGLLDHFMVCSLFSYNWPRIYIAVSHLNTCSAADGIEPYLSAWVVLKNTLAHQLVIAMLRGIMGMLCFCMYVSCICLMLNSHKYFLIVFTDIRINVQLV